MDEDWGFGNDWGNDWGGGWDGGNDWGGGTDWGGGWDGGNDWGGGWDAWNGGGNDWANVGDDAVYGGNGYDPYAGAYAEAGDFNDGGTQVAQTDGSEARVTTDDGRATIVDRNVDTFDDGTKLTTLTMSDGTRSTYSTVTDTQTFDDGSKLITENQDWGYGLRYTDTRSVDDLDSRINDGVSLIDPRTTTPDEIGTAQDIMDNYRWQMQPGEVNDLNTFINDYYLNQNSLFPDSGPTPRFGPPNNFDDA